MHRIKERTYAGVVDVFALCIVMAVSYGVFAIFIDMIGPYLLADRVLHLVYGNATLVFVSYACFILLLCWPLLRSAQLRPVKMLMTAAFALAFAYLNANPIESTRTFLTDLFSARPGSTVQRTHGRMSKYWQVDASGLKRHQRLASDFTGSVSYIHGLDPERNGDIGTILFSQGRVISVSFLPD